MKSLLTIILVMAWCGEYSLFAEFPERTASGLVPPVIEHMSPDQTAGMAESFEKHGRELRIPLRAISQSWASGHPQRTDDSSGWIFQHSSEFFPTHLPLASTRLQI